MELITPEIGVIGWTFICLAVLVLIIIVIVKSMKRKT
jgi:hypothetical protein